MRRIYRWLFALHLFVGVGAIFGGLAAIINPVNPLGIPVEALKDSPFSNYLIPGIILFTVNGLGNIFSALMIRLNSKFQGYTSSVFGWALVIWIVVQCIMLKSVAFLHVLYLLIGLLVAVLGAVVLFEQRLFPANIVINLVKYKKEGHGANKM